MKFIYYYLDKETSGIKFQPRRINIKYKKCFTEKKPASNFVNLKSRVFPRKRSTDHPPTSS